MISRTIAFVGIALFLSVACASPTRYRNAVHPAYGQTEFDRDVYECRRENTRPKVSSIVVPNIGTYDAGMVVDEDMARNCLAARGWRPVTSASSQTPAQNPVPPAANEEARTERLRAAAREQLGKPHTAAPFACTDAGWTAVKNYVVDVAPWAEAAGLRRGDRMIEFGGISLMQYDSQSEAWSKIARRENITIRVERTGQETSVQLPCRDDADAWRSRVAVLRAVTDGQWQGCIDGVQSYIKVTRMASATTLRLASECMRERSKAARQSLPDEYWRTVHAWATKAIEESRYRPAGLGDSRSSLLGAADALEKAGRSTWAHDIRQQITSFSEVPPNR